MMSEVLGFVCVLLLCEVCCVVVSVVAHVACPTVCAVLAYICIRYVHMRACAVRVCTDTETHLCANLLALRCSGVVLGV
jgi:hypothetical protein